MKSIRKSLINTVLIITSLLIIFFAPFGYHVDLGPGTNSIMAIVWDYSFEYSFRYLLVLRYFVEFYFFRLVVLIAIIFYLIGKLSKRWIIILAFIAELIPLILSIPASIFLNSQGENLYPIVISIPILLIFVIILVIIHPKIKKK